ncbi:MAG: topoisomerase [Blastocatellia bacterium]|nr:topoisomerase [Blastocatellia bacterium]
MLELETSMTRIEQLCAKGIRRTGSPVRGFRCLNAAGRKISRAELSRVEALKIPPAWTDVCINSAASGAVQAVGKDAAGRWQYIYHDSHVRHRERKKFQRLIDFADKLPAMRKAVAKDLRQSGYPRERVMASILRILSMSFIRPGSEVYANENGSYGLATLRPKHVKVKGDLVIFDFPGKSGVRQHREFRDRTTARIVRELLRRPGRDVFKYQNGDDSFVDVKRRDINVYIKEVMAGDFTAKDFRTWAATLICACALARVQAQVNGNRQANKRLLVAAIKETAEALGNTPAVCRSAYICPLIMTSFEKGQVIDRHFLSLTELMKYRGASLHPAERSLLRFLKQTTRRA